MHKAYEFIVPGPKKGTALRMAVRARNEANARRRLAKYGKTVEVIRTAAVE